MRCSRCGSRLKKKNKFCPECGAEVTWEEKDSSQVTPKGIRTLIVIGILLLIAIIAVGVLVAFGGIEGMKNAIIGEGSTETAAFSDNPEAIAVASQSVVKLNCYDENNDLVATGSGFTAFENGVIVTNYHVIENKPAKIEIVTETGKKCAIDRAVAGSVERDIVILYYFPNQVDFKLPLLPVCSSKQLQKGEKVVAIGSPLGLMNVVSTGVFSGYNNYGDVTDIQFTASISSGSSGGALFNDKGEVIGITYASYEAGQNLNLAVPMEFVEALWKNKSNMYFLEEFFDSLLPHYTVDQVLANYKDLKDTEFYLDYWTSSYGKAPEGMVAFGASSYEEIYNPNDNVPESRFRADTERYGSAPLIKIVYYDRSYWGEKMMELLIGERGRLNSLKCYGVEWSQNDKKPYVILVKE